MNFLHFDLWVLGNGEFYGGLDVLRQRMAEAEFPVLSANVTAGGEAIARPYVIKEVGPARIALLGLSVVRDQSEEYFGIDEADAIETAQALVPRLREQADVVVAVTHLGLPQDVRLAAAVDGIDLILGAHTHTVLQHGFRAKGAGSREVLICQAGDQYRYLGRVDLTLIPAPGGQGFHVTKVTAKLIPLDENVPPDPATEALLAELAQAASQPATTSASAPAPAEASPVLVPAGR
jgi:2',3'-cyclic-nucleotide 2'-phosphodiesterase (5'-nucleotidase family)